MDTNGRAPITLKNKHGLEIMHCSHMPVYILFKIFDLKEELILGLVWKLFPFSRIQIGLFL